MAVETIDDVIRALDAIIDWAWIGKSRLGYFAALYGRVTQAVKDGIAKNEFQNGPLVERLDVNFAGRYLQAFDQFRSGQEPTLSWQIAFQAASWWRPLVVEHLLAGINAHINLDLGIAAAVTSPRDQLPGLQADFNQINGVLAGLVGTVEKEMAEVSPLIGLLEKLSLKTDTVSINFSLDKAREFAWDHAVKMAPLSANELQAGIQKLDLEVAALGRLVVSPPWLVKAKLLPIRIFESSNVRRVIDVLARTKPAAARATTAR
ncbi:MAG TPA: DUF5995 family protein [Candidatus Angelobacter sp.]